jgi:predicted transcriptional regulator
MNYIELIRDFWRAHEEHSFGTTEVAVYFYLVEVCNICHCKNPFKRNNSKIEADLGISFNTLKNARNRLVQAGLIKFETKNGSPNVIYTLSNFVEVTDEVGVEVLST